MQPANASNKQEEGELIRLAKEGDKGAFCELVTRFEGRVFNLARRLLFAPTGHDDTQMAEDVTQEAFMRAYRGIKTFEGRSAFYTWLFRITFNCAHTRLRKLARNKERNLLSEASNNNEDANNLQPASTESTPSEKLEAKERDNIVRRAIAELEDDARAVIVLRETEGLSYNEIAETLSITLSAVKSRIHRARCELAEKLRGLI